MLDQIALPRKYGLLTIQKTSKNKNGVLVAQCICDCGQTSTPYLNNVLAGRTKSCGCLALKNQRKYKDITNQRFGKIVALSPTDERTSGAVVWNCRCDCGTHLKTSQRNLSRGIKDNCGCVNQEKLSIPGHHYNFLTVIFPISNNKKRSSKDKWLCQCDCGNLTIVAYTNIVNNHTKSCGCLKKDSLRETLVENTCLDNLNTKLYKNNMSGVKGVYSNRGKWHAYITFQNKRYTLGAYCSLLKAKEARQQAESELFAPLLQKYAVLLNSNQEI